MLWKQEMANFSPAPHVRAPFHAWAFRVWRAACE